jgi:hypothetical protein
MQMAAGGVGDVSKKAAVGGPFAASGSNGISLSVCFIPPTCT